MNEKERIEYGTADGFLRIYNKNFGSDYKISELSDSPDIHCVDKNGKELNIEITTTEDQDGDIKALLGRSNHKSYEALVEHNENVANGLESPNYSSINGSIDNIVDRINAKLIKDYGRNIALVVRDTSGLDWEWDQHTAEITSRLDLTHNPFDRGIWIISRTKDKLFPIVEG